MFSVVILTKNEEHDLPSCLQSLQWSDDIHVLDSGSTDDTFKIARFYNAKWHTNPFESFGKQRNYALDNFELLNKWILFLDADEVITDDFRKEIFIAIRNAPEELAGFYCCWKMMLYGKWLKRSDNFPKWQLRILKKHQVRFKDFGHGQKEDTVLGTIKYIKAPYLHYGFSKGWSAWVEKHNRYSTLESQSRINNCPPFKKVFSKHSTLRNMALKSWLSRVPGWPMFRFCHAYFFKIRPS